jgi:hypothetical protein
VCFASSVSKRIRIRVAEDGVQEDQVVVSPSRFVDAPPAEERRTTREVTEHPQ